MPRMGQIISQRLSRKHHINSRMRRKMTRYEQTSKKYWKVPAGKTLNEAKVTFAPTGPNESIAFARAGDSTRSTATGNGTTCNSTYAGRSTAVHRSTRLGSGGHSSRERPRLNNIASRPKTRRY